MERRETESGRDSVGGTTCPSCGTELGGPSESGGGARKAIEVSDRGGVAPADAEGRISMRTARRGLKNRRIDGSKTVTEQIILWRMREVKFAALLHTVLRKQDEEAQKAAAIACSSGYRQPRLLNTELRPSIVFRGQSCSCRSRERLWGAP